MTERTAVEHLADTSERGSERERATDAPDVAAPRAAVAPILRSRAAGAADEPTPGAGFERVVRRVATGHDHGDGPCGPGCAGHRTTVVQRHASPGSDHHDGPCGPGCSHGRVRVQRHAGHDHHHHEGPCGPGCAHAGTRLRRHGGEAPHTHGDEPDHAEPPRAGALVVGAADDRYEQEAERVAAQVARRWGSLTAVRRRVDGPDATSPVVGRVQRHTHEAIGAAGGAVDRRLESRIQAARHGGVPLAQDARTPMEHALGADLSGVRVHAGGQAADLNRQISADAFTIGQDIFFRDGIPDVGSASGRHLLAHELTHTLQQDGGAHRFHGAIGTISRSTSYVIHRHAAFEHYLLGQLQPRELAAIPAVRKVQDNKGQQERIDANSKLGKGLDKSAKDDSEDDAKRNEVQHLITQEMARLLEFKKNPEALEGRRSEMGKVERAPDDPDAAPVHDGAKHPKWNVPIVVLPCKDGSVVVTYSELNTLPDLFGNPEAIRATPKKQVLALLQGVRQQLYIELDNLQREIFGTSTNKLHNKVLLDSDFEGAQGPRGQAVVEAVYEKHKENEVNAATTRVGEEDEQYFAALERNACHFAPESWSQWRGYHDRAIAAATESAALRAQGKVAEAKEKANEALLLNGFGEHYLQDSFASGHLIDKTKIMRWFAQWIHANGGHGSTEKGKAEWAMKAYAANQDLESNPQRLHDKIKRGEITSPQQGAREIGMGSNPVSRLLVEWRTRAIKSTSAKHTTPDEAADWLGYADPDDALDLLEDLVELGFAKKIGKRRNEYSIHQAHLKPAQKGQSGKGAYQANMALDPSGAHSVSAQASEFDLEAYNLLMSDAHIQGSTKFFHDKFCQEGLEVISGDGTDIGRIYGDSNMMNAGGQKGLEFAAETSRQSRSAVFHAIKGWTVPYSSNAIQKRFPTKVKVDGKPIALERWNENLKAAGDAGLFEKASTFGARVVEKTGVLGDKGGISAKGALNLSAIKALGDALKRQTEHDGKGF